MPNKKFQVPINLVNLNADPATGSEGDMYFNTNLLQIRSYINGAWRSMASGTSTTTDTTQVHLYVKNGTSNTLPKGSVVYVNGSDGTNITVDLAQANMESLSSKTLGFLETDLAPNSGMGYVATDGILSGLNTNSGNAGDPIWLSPTVAGGVIYGLANKPSAPDHLVYLGVLVKKSAGSGEIFIHVQNGFELYELHNVSLDPDAGIADNEVLAWDTASQLWKNQTASEVGLAALSGATFTGPINGTSLTLSGDLTIGGTTTTVNTTTLLVKDKNIELGVVASPSNTTADGGGITLKGTADKTFNWVNSTSSWTSSENIDLASGKTFKINTNDVLSATAVLGITPTINATGFSLSGGTTPLAVTFASGSAYTINYTINGSNSQSYTLPSSGGTLLLNSLSNIAANSIISTSATGGSASSTLEVGSGVTTSTTLTHNYSGGTVNGGTTLTTSFGSGASGNSGISAQNINIGTGNFSSGTSTSSTKTITIGGGTSATNPTNQTINIGTGNLKYISSSILFGSQKNRINIGANDKSSLTYIQGRLMIGSQQSLANYANQVVSITGTTTQTGYTITIPGVGAAGFSVGDIVYVYIGSQPLLQGIVGRVSSNNLTDITVDTDVSQTTSGTGGTVGWVPGNFIVSSPNSYTPAQIIRSKDSNQDSNPSVNLLQIENSGATTVASINATGTVYATGTATFAGLNLNSATTVTGITGSGANIVSSATPQITSPSILTSITSTSTTMTLFGSTVTTLNIGAAATTFAALGSVTNFTLGGGTAAANTYNLFGKAVSSASTFNLWTGAINANSTIMIGTGAIATGVSSTINIGTGAITGTGTSTIQIGSSSNTSSIRLNLATATTVGAAGSASALPATPVGYMTINVSGTNYKVPYYNV